MRAWLAAMLLCGASAASPAEPEPAGYRGAPYNAAVPATLAGALVLDDAGAHALWWSGRVGFVDVLPRPERPANLPEGTLWRDRPHDTIPGAIWLPNTGYDALSPETLDYLLAGLAAATGGEMDAPVVLFCRSDCWMSWNAAKRAIAHGYARVYWYPAGIDGWPVAGWPVEAARPYSP